MTKKDEADTYEYKSAFLVDPTIGPAIDYYQSVPLFQPDLDTIAPVSLLPEQVADAIKHPEALPNDFLLAVIRLDPGSTPFDSGQLAGLYDILKTICECGDTGAAVIQLHPGMSLELFGGNSQALKQLRHVIVTQRPTL